MSSDADESASQQPTPQNAGSEAQPEPSNSVTPEKASSEGTGPRKILIGSQRDPAAYRPKPKRDWIPSEPKAEEKPPETASQPPEAAAEPEGPPAGGTAPAEGAESSSAPPRPKHPIPRAAKPPGSEPDATEPSAEESLAETIAEMAATLEEQRKEQGEVGPTTGRKVPIPNIRADLPPDLQEELEAAMSGFSGDTLLQQTADVARQDQLEPESRHTARVLAVRRDDVFVELGGREQGVYALPEGTEAPEVGAEVEVVVKRFDPEEGLYELNLPHMAASVADWGDLAEGMIVEALVTGHNTGGLEVQVNHIRGFVPISQIALFRVEHPEDFVGQKFNCLVTEANPDRRNLVLSRRAVLDREREESRQQLLESLQPGQVREGLVRKIMDFGAFVDLGGLDGLLHISQLSWARVKHPSEVLQEGQTIEVRVDKVDRETGKISLGYREMMESPWRKVGEKYPPQAVVRGTVAKIMDFGAFVELEPGVEGLVHISELAPHRVFRVTDVVKEGQEVEVMVLTVDESAQRISLSLKAIAKAAESERKKDEQQKAEEAPPEEPEKKKPQKPLGPLKGGLGRGSGGDQFGLKW